MHIQTHPETPAAPPSSEVTLSARGVWADRAIHILFFMIALSIPFSTKLAVHAFRLAALIWLLKLLIRRPKFRAQPLALPLFAFLLLTATSSVLSAEPAMSWGRMRTVSLLLLLPLLTQAIKSLRQVRVLALALLFSALIAVAYTGWQYTFGIGVSLERLTPDSPLARAGLVPQDVFTKVNGERIYSPATLRKILANGAPDQVLKISMRRGAPPELHDLQFTRAALVESGLILSGALGRGHPVRAQGFFKHYVPFSELLMLMAALAFGMTLCAENKRNALIFGTVFLAISAALIATLTRATLASLLIACVALFWIKAGWKGRIVSAFVLTSVFLVGSLWFQHTRGAGWLQKDDGSRYRQLMWKDGLRLLGEHPWFGVGMDSIHRHWQEWNIQAYQRFPHLKSHFHSGYMQLAVECGLPALLVWLWLLASLLAVLTRYLWNLVSVGYTPGIILGALAGTTAFCLTSLVHYSHGDAEFMIAFWFLVGLAISAGELLGTREHRAAISEA